MIKITVRRSTPRQHSINRGLKITVTSEYKKFISERQHKVDKQEEVA